ncbi:hypothetical protein BH23ACI1_BH23ACI1_09160 [soil metagenome]
MRNRGGNGELPGTVARRARSAMGCPRGRRWLHGLVAGGLVLGLAGGAEGVGTGAGGDDNDATHVVIITGLSGEDRFARDYARWGSSLVETAVEKHGVPAENVIWLAERANVHALVRGSSTKENVVRELRALVERAGATDRILILLFGHGSFANGETLINLPGPDITGKELAAMLAPLQTQRVAVVNAASASGGYIQELASPNRVVITATRSGMERNETLFGAHFVAALTGTDADTDKDGRVSLLEAFEYARREVEREYQRGNRLRSEHAVLDGVGDGKGTAAVEAASPHAALASTFFIGSRSAAAAAAQSPELRGLYAEKERLEAAIATLRTRRASMPEREYEDALEDLLVELSLNAQAIRRLEGGS